MVSSTSCSSCSVFFPPFLLSFKLNGIFSSGDLSVLSTT